MKAAVFQALHQPLAVERVDDPKPAADEVLIHVGRCGICGSDLHMTEEPAFGIAPGTVLGHEFAGEILETGKDVSDLRKGDRVAVAPLRGCGHCASCLVGEPAWCHKFTLQGGGYAELAVASAGQCRVLPERPRWKTARWSSRWRWRLHGVALSGLTPGQRVLVMGAGPIGLGVAFWARRRGAAKVAVCDLADLQADLAHTLGATSFVTVKDDARARVTAALGGEPDIVFECVGRPGAIARRWAMCAIAAPS